MPAYLLEVFVVVLGLVLLMVEAFGPREHKSALGFLGAGGLAFILVLLIWATPSGCPESYTLDPLARFYKALSLTCTIAVLLLSVDYRPLLARFTHPSGSDEYTGEFYALPVFACAGMMWMASANNFVTAFVALELVTVTFYVLVAYLRRKLGSLEAGVKYLILGALSTGFLVYGISWIYGASGTLEFETLGTRLAHGDVSQPQLLFGVALVLVGLGFKVGAVPMQIWVPDVYQGAATPTTAFLSVGSKAAGFILLLHVLEPLVGPFSPIREPVLAMILIMAVATLLVGNLAAIPQTNFKRLLAYSSIAHAGFLLLAIASWKKETDTTLGSSEVVSFYLATYLVMTLGAFFCLAAVRLTRGGESISTFDGLAKRNPELAISLTILMSALAGVPLTAGFLGKFFVFQLAVEGKLWCGVGVAFIAAAAGFYYYLKVIRAMWWHLPSDDERVIVPKICRITITTCAVATIVLGIFPQPILWLLE